jgi:hypothetical protein
MTRRRRARSAAAAALAAAVAAGCGVGEGESTEGDATLTVSREYGREELLETTVEDPPESETVLRVLDRAADVETRYGGGFVQSIDGLEGDTGGGRALDWFFFVNGVESSLGAAEVEVRAGDRIWWDYRDWSEAMRAPAVVGSWPEPFAQASAGAERVPVRVVCAGARPPCRDAHERLADAGVEASVERPERGTPEAVRMLVGPWHAVREDEVARALERDPARSGVFARFDRAGGGWALVALDAGGEAVHEASEGAGLVAALREGENPPTWVVTGTDSAGVGEAVSRLGDDELRLRYALFVSDGSVTSLPTEAEASR